MIVVMEVDNIGFERFDNFGEFFLGLAVVDKACCRTNALRDADVVARFCGDCLGKIMAPSCGEVTRVLHGKHRDLVARCLLGAHEFEHILFGPTQGIEEFIDVQYFHTTSFNLRKSV